jgi:CMP-N,N'-diacetyllegionaminic acid synthase
MIIYIDIDDTICRNELLDDELDYSKATPIKDAIKKANNLFDDGHMIIYWTARGTVSGIDWRDITIKQFKDWGVKYHELKFGKPNYDLFIDDKVINSNTYFK